MSCRVGYNGDVKNYDWGGFVDADLNPVNPPNTEAPPHFFLGGPSSGSTDAIATFRAIVPDDIPFVALLTEPNVFTDTNTFNSGIRLGGIVIVTSGSYTITHEDYEILVNASTGPATITLPTAIGSGQLFRVKKTDPTANIVTVITDGADLIDGSSTITLEEQWVGCQVYDADLSYWDSMGSGFGGGGGGGGIPPNVALTDAENIFLELNTFTGIRLATRTVFGDYTATSGDFEILADATGGDLTITLPLSNGNGQYYRIKKIDDTAGVVSVVTQGSDLIDGSVSVNFTDQYADAQLFAAASDYWDNTGSAASDSGGGADFGVNGRVVDLSPIKGFSFEVFDGVDWIEQVRYTEPSGGPTPTPGVDYFWRPEITDDTTLAAFTTTASATGTRIDVRYSNGLRVYVLDAGAADGGDPGQVAPDDYDAGTNDKHWSQIL